jgi:NADP-dependent 3-hydroxy acid dehydrogenase YdfG
VRLEDKVTIITGAGGGMGRTAATMFAAEGARVVCVDVSEEMAESAASDVRAAGGQATAVAADVSSEDAARRMVDHAMATYGRIDALYNNAGIMPAADHSVIDTDVETWDKVMAVNLRGVFLGCKYAIPKMVEQGSGSIINVASFVAILGCSVPQDAYTASKGAVLSLTRSLAVQFAPQGVREVIKPAVELLAGIPSVVIGFFALMVLATWLQDTFGLLIRLNAVTAGIGLALAVIPIVYTVSEDALSAVPQSFRDGSQALGANRWQTAWRVVLPAATPGVFAACVLGAGRAIGETMIVLMASGNAATMSFDPTRSFRSFSATIAAELGEVVHGDPHYRVLFFIGAALFVITFFLNLAGHAYVSMLKRKLKG